MKPNSLAEDSEMILSRNEVWELEFLFSRFIPYLVHHVTLVGYSESSRFFLVTLNLYRRYACSASFHQATTREFQKTNGLLKMDEPHAFGIPSCSPDLTLSPHGIDVSRSNLWRDRDAFGEVNPSNKQGPKPAIPGTIPRIVRQSADFARLFMFAPPFMLFYVGILIFGTGFCAGSYDRDEVTFLTCSKTQRLLFALWTLRCCLSAEERGFDPAVHVLTDLETQILTGSTKYPSAVVSPCGNDPRQWCTIGPPI